MQKHCQALAAKHWTSSYDDKLIYSFEHTLYVHEDMIDDRSYAHNFKLVLVKLEPAKNSRLNGIQTNGLCDTGAAVLPTELSSQLGACYVVSSEYTHIVYADGVPSRSLRSLPSNK